MRELLEEQRSLGFPAFAGANANIRIPLREGVLNTLIGDKVVGRGPIKGLTLQILDSNRISFDLSHDIPLIPKQIRGDLVLAPVTNFESDPRLLIMYNVGGLVGTLLKLVPKNLIAEKLPSFVTLSDNRIFVDFKALLDKQKLGDILPLIHSLRFSSQRGALFLELHLHITEKAS